MLAYKNIIYCTDYSEGAEIAWLPAADMARRFGAKPHEPHALKSRRRRQPAEIYSGQPEGEAAQASPELMARAAAELEGHCKPRLEGVSEVVYRPGVGSAFVENPRRARGNRIDLIIPGAPGDSGSSPTHYGSAVGRASRRSNCTVTAIRNPEKTYTL